MMIASGESPHHNPTIEDTAEDGARAQADAEEKNAPNRSRDQRGRIAEVEPEESVSQQLIGAGRRGQAPCSDTGAIKRIFDSGASVLRTLVQEERIGDGVEERWSERVAEQFREEVCEGSLDMIDRVLKGLPQGGARLLKIENLPWIVKLLGLHLDRGIDLRVDGHIQTLNGAFAVTMNGPCEHLVPQVPQMLDNLV
jgi:hypothetical protein